MYSALDVAKYIISKCKRDQKPISNLQLQKILYYLQREFIELGEPLFYEHIEAWQFGPVVPEVYKMYCGFGSSPITITYNESEEIREEDVDIINSIVNKKRELNPWDMVEDTHKPGKAWEIIYENGLGDHQIIPIDLIRSNG